MSQPSSPRSRSRTRHIDARALPDDLYLSFESWPRRGRPPRNDEAAFTVTDDWPHRVPVTDLERAVFETWFGDLLDELLGPGSQGREPQ